jgi:predicted flap endonuclease-1-like 5' DNA nuclease
METSAAAMAADEEFDDDFDDDFDDEEINSTEEEAAAKAAAILLVNEEKEKVETEPPASKATKKEEEQKAELLRVKERASTIDFETLGMATSSELKNEVNEGADTLEVANASDFDESGYARISDSDGSSIIAWTGKNGDILTGVSGVTRRFAAASIVTAKDDLQVIKGIGPFLEEKLNALGITTYRQIANMDSKLEEEVNIAIEFFPGRVKRDQWVTQAKILLGEDLKLDEKIPNQIDESQAEEEAAAKAAAEEEAAAKAAAVMARLKAAQEEAERIAKEEAERALAEMDEKERAAAAKAAAAEEKKRKLLARVAEKAENIDFATIGIAATSDIVSEITTESTSITLSDASAFPESGNAYIYDPSGNILLKWEGKEDNTLIGVSGITKKPPLGAIIIERDNLQDIKGVGPFIEEKLNALGIYTFKQIANMNLEIEEQVNVAIEFFPGRIRRDEWAKQAHDFITEDES